MSTLPEAVTEQQKKNKEEYERMDTEVRTYGRPPVQPTK